MPKNITFSREKILEDLIPVFIEKGYNGTSMQDIVSASGLNRSSLYNSFGDKQALYMAVLTHYAKGQSDIKSEILRLDPNIKYALKKFFEMLFIRQINKKTPTGCLLANCSLEMGKSDSDIRKILLDNNEMMISHFKSIIELGQKNGDIDQKVHPENYASLLFNNLLGLRLINGSSYQNDLTVRIIDQLFDQL